MSFELFVNQAVIAATLRLNVAIEASAHSALFSLGLPSFPGRVSEAKRQEEENSPLYVASIVVCGNCCCDMYDEHPGYAYFWKDARRSIQAPPYCALGRAMQLAERAFEDARQERAEAGEEYDGLFSPSSVLLLDQFGLTVQEYDGARWTESFPSKEEWGSIEKQSAGLLADSFLESGWDNFETARGLRAQAASLLRSVEMARAVSRVIK